MASTVQAICEYPKTWVLDPVQKMGEEVNEALWTHLGRERVQRNIAGVLGSSLIVHGTDALYRDFQQGGSVISTGGALLTCVVGVGLLILGGQIRDAYCNISQKKRIAQLNQDMLREPGAKNQETILIAIDSHDHNNALAVNEQFVANTKRWAQKYSIHTVLIKNPGDWDRACNHLESQGKIVKHVFFSAHADTDKVEVGGINIREYLATDKRHPVLNVERCFIDACTAGIPDGEAEILAKQNPEISVWAPGSTVSPESTFFYLDSTSGEPELIQFSEVTRSVITKIYRDTMQNEYPIDPKNISELCCDSSSARKCVIVWQSNLNKNAQRGHLPSLKALEAQKAPII